MKFIRNLSANRPTAAGRSAYINCAGTLLMLYPREASQLLFSDEPGSEKSFSYLFINLILVDIRATLPSLLAKLNAPEYPQISRRLASGFDILAAFIGHLIAWMEELDNNNNNNNNNPEAAGGPPAEEETAFNMPPDLVLKLSKSIGETISVIMEYLRDRWDASVAGALGLHPEARAGAAHTAAGSHRTLAWDYKDGSAAADPFTLSALRAIALWLRDDDGDALREEAAALMDMFIELYQRSFSSSSSVWLLLPPSGSSNDETTGQDYRLPILAALEGILRTEDGVEAFNAHDGWRTLSKDLLFILSETSNPKPDIEPDFWRGTRVAFVLSLVMESEPSTPENWMGLVTAVAAYDVPAVADGDGLKSKALLDFQTDVLQLAAGLLANANPGMRRRYVHSADAIRGIARQLREKSAREDSPAASDLDDVLATLA